MRTISYFIVLIMSLTVYAHSTKADVNPNQSDDKVYKRVNVMPSYPGGAEGILSFIAKNIRYPKDALESGKQGTVICEFIINKDGSFSDIVVKKSIFPSLDKEAIRVIKSFPKWKPGLEDGKAVRILYSLPVNFRIR
ncbi:energy transducer TonB [Bacteroides sp.]|uniref:energy transducer TonB n=1 Tax=Bacteroides sp. TaxID=29523 RepID=UPI0026076265|nr:energy transducer TonB [Bacteroides sp.]MDD3040938.1 energy transducer TonB [Bacteroides sp.]